MLSALNDGEVLICYAQLELVLMEVYVDWVCDGFS